MKKKKVSPLFIGSTIFIVLLILLAFLTRTTNGDWRAALASAEPKIIYIGRPTCYWCTKFKPGLDNLANQYDYEYVYVNTDSISKSELNELLKSIGLESENFGTPYTAVVQNNKKIDGIPGYINEERLFGFLQTNQFIGEDNIYKPNNRTVVVE